MTSDVNLLSHGYLTGTNVNLRGPMFFLVKWAVWHFKRNTKIIFEQHCTHPVMRTPKVSELEDGRSNTAGFYTSTNVWHSFRECRWRRIAQPETDSTTATAQLVEHTGCFDTYIWVWNTWESLQMFEAEPVCKLRVTA